MSACDTFATPHHNHDDRDAEHAPAASPKHTGGATNMNNHSHHTTPRTDQQPEPGATTTCDTCGEPIIAKCGTIIAWHWSHYIEPDQSDSPESLWHRAMKDHAVSRGATTEVRHGHHRADIVWPDGNIWELQTGFLPVDQIMRRETQYGDQLTWIYRITQPQFDRLWNAGEGWFKWTHPAKSLLAHRRPVIWHHRDRHFHVTFREHDKAVHVKFGQFGDHFSEPAFFHIDDV